MRDLIDSILRIQEAVRFHLIFKRMLLHLAGVAFDCSRLRCGCFDIYFGCHAKILSIAARLSTFFSADVQSRYTYVTFSSFFRIFYIYCSCSIVVNNVLQCRQLRRLRIFPLLRCRVQTTRRSLQPQMRHSRPFGGSGVFLSAITFALDVTQFNPFTVWPGLPCAW